jgi:hypothetical protein
LLKFKDRAAGFELQTSKKGKSLKEKRLFEGFNKRKRVSLFILGFIPLHLYHIYRWGAAFSQ